MIKTLAAAAVLSLDTPWRKSRRPPPLLPWPSRRIIITTIIIITTSITIIITITTRLRKPLPLRLPRNNLELRRDLFDFEFALNSKLSAQSFVRRAFLS
jgi:hypothetical protein